MSAKNKVKKFPEGFLWGAATASHQVEGGQHNDWSEWEKVNAPRLARESEQNFQWNPNWKKFKREATDPKNYISGNACNQYHRYEEDFDIMDELHLKAYRFSIEWSRIEPEEGIFDQKEIDHYRAEISSLQRRGIEPFVTLWHWTLPLWLAGRSGTLSNDFSRYFERYTETLVSAFGDDVRFWITENEPDVQTAQAYLKGVWPPQEKSVWKYLRALHHLIAAHKRAYQVIKKRFPATHIGIAKHQVYFELARETIFNRFLKKIADWIWNFYFLNRIKYHQDFIGLNHYNRNVVDNGFKKNPNNMQTDFGWEYWPDSIYGALIELRKYGKPIYITENGLADADDTLRQKFIPAALAAVHRAISDGVDVRGYFYWSLLDNFEWDKGYWLRFGLVQMDYATQKRTIRASARGYAKIAEKNALE
ncbi:MAG: family 1 glycosylhydrolase [Candidatus Yonathbacteria bacterium]|nr:family 1 glycosylhydrolase [Candidatus Yonathbacteria bacterium]